MKRGIFIRKWNITLIFVIAPSDADELGKIKIGSQFDYLSNVLDSNNGHPRNDGDGSHS